MTYNGNAVSTLIRPEPFPGSDNFYGVGKLGLDLLPISLSRLEALGGSAVQEIANILRSHPPFHLIENDLLEFEKLKAMQGIEGFLKV
jgi:hypothetical protein